ncbi:MAG: hypothetical protein QG656_1416, partial [Candidatus Hydrogenedentes bacterium]|nr:hypothetical protein [Candidatus Hydrogenedentota bacterium]
MDYADFAVAQLRAVIGNNAEMGEHRAGYNGVFALRRAEGDESAYVPLYAGLNLEHFFDARPRHTDSNVFFEPRRAQNLTCQYVMQASLSHGLGNHERCAVVAREVFVGLVVVLD